MTIGYYKNQIDYGKHVSYGKSVSYGKHINYNKPSGGPCDVSTYWTSSADSVIPFVGDPLEPEVGPMRFAAVNPPNTITADISYDPAVDDVFTVGRLFRDEVTSGHFMELWDSTNTNNFIVISHVWSGANVFRVQAKDGVTLQTCQFAGGVQDNFEVMGFKLTGAAATKSLVATLDAVDSTSKLLNFTGITFDKITIGSRLAETVPSLDSDIYYINSTQLGDANFTTRLPPKFGTNTITSTLGTVYNVNSAQYFPYYGAYKPLSIAYMGDSITNQYNYVGLLEASLDATYPNAVHTKYAENGWVSFQLAPAGFPIGDYTNGGEVVDPTRNIDKVLADGNDIIVLYIGTNDNTLGYDEAGVIAVYQAIIDAATTAGKAIIAVTMTSRTSGTPTTNSFANSVSATMRTEWSAYSNVYIADVNTDMGLGGVNNYVDPLMVVDTVHPSTPLGEQTQADAVEPHVNAIIGLNSWTSPYLKSESQCEGNTLQFINGFAQTINGIFRRIP